MRQAFCIKLFRYRWVGLINQMLGLVYFSEWFVLLNNGFFSPHGFLARINEITVKSHVNYFNSMVLFVVSHVPQLSYIACIIMFVIPTLMILRIYRYPVNCIGSVIAVVYVLAHLTYPGTWLFEYFSPCLFLFITTYASYEEHKVMQPHSRIMGLHKPSLLLSCILMLIGVLISAVIYYFLWVSDAGGVHVHQVALEVSISFLILFILSEVLNRSRMTLEDDSKQIQPLLSFIHYHTLDYMLLSIGLILICQVVMDQQLKWFTTLGYKNLINVYATFSHTPLFIRHFLQWSSAQAAWMSPLQHAVESALAAGCVLLLYRLPVSLGVFGLCALLAFSEFGVPATWPPVPHGETTWTWELLNITFVAGVIALYHGIILVTFEDKSDFFSGEGVFSNLSLWKSLSIIVAISVFIAGYILLTHSLKMLNHPYAIESSICCFLYLCFTLAIDQLRTKKKTLSFC